MDTTIDLPPELTEPPLSQPVGGDGVGDVNDHVTLEQANGGGGEGDEPGMRGPTSPSARTPLSAAKKSRRQGFLFATTAIVVVAVSAGVILHKPLLATIARLRHQAIAATGSVTLPKAQSAGHVLAHPDTGKAPLNTAIPGLSVTPIPDRTPATSHPAPQPPMGSAPSSKTTGVIGTSATSQSASDVDTGSGVAIPHSTLTAAPAIAATAGTENRPATSHAAPAHVTPAVATGANVPTASTNPAPPSPLVGPMPRPGTLQSIPHPLKVATHLVAAPSSSTYDVQTASLVAAIARLVAELRSQNAAMQVEISTLRHQVDRQMLAFNQRLTFDQAHDAIALASASDPAVQTKALLPVHSAQIFPASAPHVAPVSPSSYAVQAASPGLAMLVRNGVTYEVSVGSVVPGVGRVISIVEYGSGWVVRTDHGVIR